jgi:hypothetical protein
MGRQRSRIRPPVLGATERSCLVPSTPESPPRGCCRVKTQSRCGFRRVAELKRPLRPFARPPVGASASNTPLARRNPVVGAIYLPSKTQPDKKEDQPAVHKRQTSNGIASQSGAVKGEPGSRLGASRGVGGAETTCETDCRPAHQAPSPAQPEEARCGRGEGSKTDDGPEPPCLTAFL